MRVVTVSYSELASARQCQLKHHLQYKERWSKSSTGPRALGTRWHSILATHYNSLAYIQSQRDVKPVPGYIWGYDDFDIQNVSEKVAWTFVQQPEDATRTTLLWMYEEHLKVYGYQPHWTIIGVERESTQPLPKLPGQELQFKLKSIIDLVVKDQFGRVWVVDHKSGQNMISESYTGFMDQFGLYEWSLIQEGFRVHGNILQFQKTTRYKKKTPEQSYSKQLHMDHSIHELDEIALAAVRTAYQVYTWPTETLGEPPSHPNPELCQRFCDFTEAHLTARKGLTKIQDYLEGTGFSQDLTVVDPKYRSGVDEW